MDEIYRLEEDFLKFTFAMNYEDRMRTLLHNSLLLNGKFLDEILDYVNEMNEVNENSRLFEHYHLLEEIHKNGMEVLINFHSSDEIDSSFIDFSSSFNTLKERKKFLHSNLFLLSDESLSVINSLITRDSKLFNFKDFIMINHRFYNNLLKACRLIPIDDAFKDFEVPEERFVKAFNALLAAQSPYDLTRIMGIYNKELQESQMRNVFMHSQAKFQEQKTHMARLKVAWGFISNFQKNKEILWF